MDSLTRIAITVELEGYLQCRYQVQKEVLFKRIMDTDRMFRADYLLNDNIIVEVNGGQWIGGRHHRGGKGYENDLIKINLAQKNGFKVYQFTYEMLLNAVYKQFI
jgi:hypothetical protein